jgi:D-tyrosyl-tRNA(Tyr) deacylase
VRAVIQRLGQAAVSVDGEIVGSTDPTRPGLLILLGVAEEDDTADADFMVNKIVNLRIFEDDDGKMNRSILDVQGTALVISQFTLLGDCRKGRRPSYAKAMAPEPARRLVDYAVTQFKKHLDWVQEGRFGEDMSVSLVNDGPVTLVLDSRKQF